MSARDGRLAPELREATADAIAGCEALLAMCRAGRGDLVALEEVARRAALATGRVAGYAHMSRKYG